MSQLQLPFFPAGVTAITRRLAFGVEAANGCQDAPKSGDRRLNPENTPIGVLCAVAG